MQPVGGDRNALVTRLQPCPRLFHELSGWVLPTASAAAGDPSKWFAPKRATGRLASTSVASYHQVAISRPDTTWRWEGPTETAEDGFIDGATAGRWLAGWRRAAVHGPGKRSTAWPVLL